MGIMTVETTQMKELTAVSKSLIDIFRIMGNWLAIKNLN